MTKIKLNSIQIDGGTQPREDIDIDTVAEYAEAMKEGDQFPPVVVFNDGAKYWLADGFHRYHASNSIGYIEIEADVKSGTKRDAVLYSVSANSKHGLRRTNSDKRKAVMTLLNDDEWSGWSDREIARQCAVSHEFVRQRRSSLSTNDSEKNRTYTTKHGTEATMNTSNIGKRNIFGKKITAEDVAELPENDNGYDLPDNVDAETGEILEESKPRKQPERKRIGLEKAHEAIAKLKQIPPNDGLLQEAYDTVIRWINNNR
ncbi:MAG: ParB/RepB/Spo0J family partition protein [Balneolaceae bacterium]